MLGVMSMVNAWHAIYANLPSPIRALVTISVVVLFMCVLYNALMRIRS